jgi:hypothetical protein
VVPLRGGLQRLVLLASGLGSVARVSLSDVGMAVGCPWEFGVLAFVYEGLVFTGVF